MADGVEAADELTPQQLRNSTTRSNSVGHILACELDRVVFHGIECQMGEVYRARGETAKAKESYQKALQKAPNHQQAQRRLSEIG